METEVTLPSGIIVPRGYVQPILLFCDETYLFNQSGFIQAGLPIPESVYLKTLKPLCAGLLRRLGSGAKEFKGANIKPGTRRIYKEFLQLFVNVVAIVGEKHPLWPIISIDGMGVYSGTNFKYLQTNVRGALNKLGVHGEEHIADEFSLQALWLHQHYGKMAPIKHANDLVIVLDEKHRYAEKCTEKKLVFHERFQAPLLWEFQKVLASFADSLGKRRKTPMPRIRRFEFKNSKNEFGLQAADLFSHLLYNALKYEMGIRNEATTSKHEMLLGVCPAFQLPRNLAELLSIVRIKNGQKVQEEVACNKPDLISTFILAPCPESPSA